MFFILCTVLLLEYVTVSARIKRELYEKLKKHGVVISDVIRKALEEEIRKREEEELEKALKRAQEILTKISSEEIVRVIRSGREER